jgi:hypothetical protein
MGTYKVGTGSQKIGLMVDIDTFGLAASRASVIDISTEDPSVSVGHSADATGDIQTVEIGTPQFLARKRLAVFTKIDLVGDPETRKKESERLGGKYILEHGADGRMVFTNADKTINGDFSSVLLYFEIDLIA